MTVVIQRTYFKATHGKRIFRMTPIHHAFEMRGWREVKIDGFFCADCRHRCGNGNFFTSVWHKQRGRAYPASACFCP